VTLETGAEVKASTNVQVGTVVKMHIEEDRYIGRV
jgi:ribosomal 50S subunit-recycling heat shock protein